MSESKWLNFELFEKGEKTSKYDVTTKDGIHLGVIKWFGRWRRYSYFTSNDPILEPQCLRDIANFIDGLMEERKKNKK